MEHKLGQEASWAVDGRPEERPGLHLRGSATQWTQTRRHPHPGGCRFGCHGDWQAQRPEGLHVRQTQGLRESDADPEVAGPVEAPGQDVRGLMEGWGGGAMGLEGLERRRGGWVGGEEVMGDAFNCGGCQDRLIVYCHILLTFLLTDLY